MSYFWEPRQAFSCMWILQSVSQDQRERRVTVDEVPSGIYLYPEEESGVDNIFTPVSNRSSAALFEEAQKEILKLMKIEVCFIFLWLLILYIHNHRHYLKTTWSGLIFSFVIKSIGFLFGHFPKSNTDAQYSFLVFRSRKMFLSNLWSVASVYKEQNAFVTLVTKPRIIIPNGDKIISHNF